MNINLDIQESLVHESILSQVSYLLTRIITIMKYLMRRLYIYLVCTRTQLLLSKHFLHLIQNLKFDKNEQISHYIGPK